MTEEEWIRAHFGSSAPYLQAALDAEPVPTHTLRHVRAELDSGRCQLWPTQQSAVVTEIVTHPTGVKTCSVWLAAGALSEIMRTERAVEAFARAVGCALVEFKGRRGWIKPLKERGFAAAATHFVKRLDNG